VTQACFPEVTHRVGEGDFALAAQIREGRMAVIPGMRFFEQEPESDQKKQSERGCKPRVICRPLHDSHKEGDHSGGEESSIERAGWSAEICRGERSGGEENQKYHAEDCLFL
jgi:hypothetical protein